MSDSKTKQSKALAALTAGALALPAFQVQSASAPTESEVSYRYSTYSEDDAAASDVNLGSTKRYDINIHQFSLLKPVASDYSMKIDVLTEKLSGASPYGTVNVGGEPKLTMSGASITEQREDITISGKHYGESVATGVTIGKSTENDYEALYFGGDIEWEFNSKNTAVQLSAGQSNDKIMPTDAVLYGRITNASKKTQNISFGISQVLGKNDIFQLGFGISTDTGYLSDPYKTAETRPSERNRSTISARYRHYYSTSKTTLKLDYRYYSDDWNVKSHTLRTAWDLSYLDDKIHLIPSIRYYSQTEAYFYEPYDTGARYYSSDYRLSPYGAISLGLKFKHNFKSWSYLASIERYISDAKLSLQKVDVENPGLVSYTRMTVGFNIKF